MGHVIPRQALLVILFIIAVSPALAETEPKQPAQKPERGKQKTDNELDFAAIQDSVLNIYKEQLGVTNEEWTIIRPRLSKVRHLSQMTEAMTAMIRWNTVARPLISRHMKENGYPDMMSDMIRGFAENMQRARGLQLEGEDAQQDLFKKAMTELQETLKKEAPTTAEIKARMAAFRGAKEKTRQELFKAQTELKEVLTVKQEATLLMMGFLD